MHRTAACARCSDRRRPELWWVSVADHPVGQRSRDRGKPWRAHHDDDRIQGPHRARDDYWRVRGWHRPSARRRSRRRTAVAIRRHDARQRIPVLHLGRTATWAHRARWPGADPRTPTAQSFLHGWTRPFAGWPDLSQSSIAFPSWPWWIARASQERVALPANRNCQAEENWWVSGQANSVGVDVLYDCLCRMLLQIE